MKLSKHAMLIAIKTDKKLISTGHTECVKLAHKYVTVSKCDHYVY